MRMQYKIRHRVPKYDKRTGEISIEQKDLKIAVYKILEKEKLFSEDGLLVIFLDIIDNGDLWSKWIYDGLNKQIRMRT
jgi:regulator of RNase E activity RraB